MNWTEENNKLIAEFTFEDFSQAWAFMTEVAILAERKNHHPCMDQCLEQSEYFPHDPR
jgi:pterin-4a-carbinolamine dehydratase